MSAIFFGTYNRTLDTKNRLSIPSKIRGLLGEKIYLLKGFDGCISLYNEENFLKLNEKLNTLSYTNPKIRSYVRSVYSSIVELEIDKVNRIQIPLDIINLYNISKDVVVIGSGDHFEVFSSEIYEKYNEESLSNFDDNAKETE
jgi:MraZ protein